MGAVARCSAACARGKRPFRQADPVESLGRGDDQRQGSRVGEADVLAGEDDHAAEDEPRVFPGVDHAGHPVQGGVGVRPPHRLDEGADRVEVVVPFLVVENGAALDRFFGDGEIDVHAAVARSRRIDRELEGVQQRPGVAVGDVDEMGKGVVVDGQAIEISVPARVGKGVAGNRVEVALGQGFELEQAAAGYQRPVDGEVGVFSGRADQDDGAVLDPGQERVLLGLVEAVDLVDEEDGALAVQVAAVLCLVDRLADVGDPGEHGVDGDEMGARRVGDDVGEGGLAGSGGGRRR